MDLPASRGHFVKFKVTDRIAFRHHEDGFSEFGFASAEQADFSRRLIQNRPDLLFQPEIFPYLRLFSMGSPVVHFNFRLWRYPVRHTRTPPDTSYRLNILLIGFQLLHIKRGPQGHVGLKYRASAFVKADGFQKPVFRNCDAIRCGQLFQKRTGQRDVFPPHSRRCQRFCSAPAAFFEADLHLLALIGKADAGVCDGDFLSRVGQNHFGLWIAPCPPALSVPKLDSG